jgi:DNA-binding NarL/FixJ family response regulator
MDLRLPDIGGIDALIAIRTEFAKARVIMLTTFEGDAEIQPRASSRSARLHAQEHAAETTRWKCHPQGA